MHMDQYQWPVKMTTLIYFLPAQLRKSVVVEIESDVFWSDWRTGDSLRLHSGRWVGYCHLQWHKQSAIAIRHLLCNSFTSCNRLWHKHKHTWGWVGNFYFQWSPRGCNSSSSYHVHCAIAQIKWVRNSWLYTSPHPDLHPIPSPIPLIAPRCYIRLRRAISK